MLLHPKRWQRTVSMMIGIDLALCVVHLAPPNTQLTNVRWQQIACGVQEDNTGEAKIDWPPRFDENSVLNILINSLKIFFLPQFVLFLMWHTGRCRSAPRMTTNSCVQTTLMTWRHVSCVSRPASITALASAARRSEIWSTTLGTATTSVRATRALYSTARAP